MSPHGYQQLHADSENLSSFMQTPKRDVVRSELMWLVKMSKLLPPFLQEFNDSLQAMRKRSQSVSIYQLVPLYMCT